MAYFGTAALEQLSGDVGRGGGPKGLAVDNMLSLFRAVREQARPAIGILLLITMGAHLGGACVNKLNSGVERFVERI